jgi:tripartite-type tricarboxylate transporter receptor subunit TctC
MKRIAALLLVVLVFMAPSVFAKGQEEWPARDITHIVVYGAGGGTDTSNRVIMAEMAKQLGVNINVTNVTGAGGAAGMTEALSRPADGYTWAGLTESITPQAALGNWNQRVNVWDFFIICGSPDVISVPVDSPYKSIQDIVKAAKANPGKINAGASNPGSVHHLNLLGFQKGAGIELNYIPFESSNAAQNAVLTGEIEFVITAVAEQSELLKAGKLIPLNVLTPTDGEFKGKKIPSAFPEIPALSKYLPLPQVLGFGIPKTVPEEIRLKARAAFIEAMKADSVKKFADDRSFTLYGQYGDEANKIFDDLESKFSWMLQDLGLAKTHPDKLGIPKP